MLGGLERIRERIRLVGFGVKGELGNLKEKREQIDEGIEKVKKKIGGLEVKIEVLRKVLEKEGEKLKMRDREGWGNEKELSEARKKSRSKRVQRDLIWGEESMRMLEEIEMI